jgi:hypothetical protein
METALRQFLDALDDQEKLFIPGLSADNLGLTLRAAINELDWYFYNLARCENPSVDQQEQFYLLKLGVARLIRLTFESRPSFDVPALTFRRRGDITIPALEIAAGLGMIEHGRRVAQSVKGGLCSIQRTRANEFLITLPSAMLDDEYYERAVAEHYRTESRLRTAELLETERGREVAETVRDLLTELVFPFRTHFIGYGAHPVLDGYFFGIASAELALHDGYDSFHHSARFGGIPFQKYILALTYFIAIDIRHERFAQALVEKQPTIKLEDILTISADTKTFVESIKEALNYFGSAIDGFEEVSLEDARRIFEVLTLSSRSTALIGRPATALPVAVQWSEEGFVHCLAGARTEPMQYLLDSLRHHFPQDYARNQQTREKAMQSACKRVLNECFRDLEYRENIKIRLHGRALTDIDLVVLEASTGTVLLCQLKHQELYGADLHSREIRTKRLREQVPHWFDALDDWSGIVGEAGVRASLRLKKSFPALCIKRLVISRHYAYPLKDLARGSFAAYGSWAQFFNSIQLVRQQNAERRSLSDLLATIKRGEAPGGPQHHLQEPRTEWIVRDLKFTVSQED